MGERFDLPLGEVCDVKQGRYLGPGDMSEVQTDQTPIPVIGANGILGYTDQVSYAEPVTLVTCRGSNCGMLQRTKGPTWISNNAMACPPKKPHDSRYIHYVLQATDFGEVITGSAQPQITTGHLNTKLVTITRDQGEQKRIAEVLGTLDDKIELNRRMNATLEATARALFQSWFIDFDPVRRNMDRNQPSTRPSGRPSPIGRREGDEGLFELDAATAALFPNSFEESPLGHIPKGWEVATIEEATSLIIDYRGRTPKKMGSDWSPTGIPAVSAKNVKGGRLVRPDTFNFVSEELYEQWMKDKLALGDILMTSEAPLGELYYLALDARYCLSQRIFALRANPAVCVSAFLYYWLESPACQTDIVNRGTGTTVEGIRQSELRRVSVLLPSLPIQKAAAKFLAAWTEQIHRNEEQSRTLAILRDTLLPKLLSGELSVREAERDVADPLLSS